MTEREVQIYGIPGRVRCIKKGYRCPECPLGIWASDECMSLKSYEGGLGEGEVPEYQNVVCKDGSSFIKVETIGVTKRKEYLMKAKSFAIPDSLRETLKIGSSSKAR